MTSTLYAPAHTPGKVLSLLKHLQAHFPLTNTHHMNIYFENRPNVRHHAMGFASPGVHNGRLYTNLHIGLGFKKTPRPLTEVLDTLAHEYRHAIQYDNATLGDDTDIAKYGDCVEAFEFAAKIVPEFLAKYNLKLAA